MRKQLISESELELCQKILDLVTESRRKWQESDLTVEEINEITHKTIYNFLVEDCLNLSELPGHKRLKKQLAEAITSAQRKKRGESHDK